jgi:hypothetical protein
MLLLIRLWNIEHQEHDIETYTGMTILNMRHTTTSAMDCLIRYFHRS